MRNFWRDTFLPVGIEEEEKTSENFVFLARPQLDVGCQVKCVDLAWVVDGGSRFVDAIRRLLRTGDEPDGEGRGRGEVADERHS